jgi:hypothetical protein
MAVAGVNMDQAKTNLRATAGCRFSARFALCLGLGERFSLFFPAEQGNPASSPHADSTNFAGRKKGRPLPERPRLW